MYQPSGVGRRRRRSNSRGGGVGAVAMFMREDRLVDESAMRSHTFFPVRNRISTTSRPADNGLSASVDDNVGLRVVMPTETERTGFIYGHFTLSKQSTETD